ncbi:MAG: type II toxin-antitoxin system PemK/MazF family toxin [Chitinophagaceae bacterium]|nr:type II toxin-antitoxin system PemK/MazF family toxin [Chitinophagaceae bacterium]
MIKGDIILIPFPFTDFTGNKLRPAVVLIETDYDLTVCFITTRLKWKEGTDIELSSSSITGIKKPSLIRLSKMATVDKLLAVGKLGELQPKEILEMNTKLKKLFQLT